MKTVAIFAAGLVFISGLAAAGTAVRIADEGTLGRTHDIAPGTSLPAPGYPEIYAGSGDDVCIALGYTVKKDGTTGDFRLLRAWSSNRALAERQERYLDAFAGAAADAVSKWRFVPKQAENAASVQTVATVTFRAGSAVGLTERCQITDLAAHYRRLENGRVAVRKVSDNLRETATMANIRLAESMARRRLPSGNSP